jgi:hypothetical protein
LGNWGTAKAARGVPAQQRFTGHLAFTALKMLINQWTSQPD